MDDYESTETGIRLLPGVDLALWLRLAAMVVLVVAAGAITLAVY